MKLQTPGGERLRRSLVVGAALVILLAGLRAVAPILDMVLLALFLAITVTPFQDLLLRKKLKPSLAVAITLLAILISGSLILYLFAGTVSKLIDRMPAYGDRLMVVVDQLREFLVSKGLDPARVMPSEALDPSKLIQFAGAFLQTLAGALGNGFFLLLLIILMLIELATVSIKTAKGEYRKGTFIYTFSEIVHDTSKFMGISAAVGIVQAALNTVVLLVVGVDFALTWGILFFFVNFIPVVGFLLGLVPPLVIALLGGGTQQAVEVLVGWWVLNILFDNVIRPKYLKKGFDISILAIVLSLVFWSFILGPVGALLGVPLTQSIKKFMLLYEEEQTA